MHNNASDWNFMKEMMESLKYGVIKDNTGGHIHFDHSIVKNKNILYLLKLQYTFELTIYEFSKGEFKRLRDITIVYAKTLPDLEKNILLIENGKLSINHLACYDKSCGLNFQIILVIKKLIKILMKLELQTVHQIL